MMQSRMPVALGALVLLLIVLAIDVAVSKAPNPFVQPPLIALGSGQEASGAMCATVPGQ